MQSSTKSFSTQEIANIFSAIFCIEKGVVLDYILFDYIIIYFKNMLFSTKHPIIC